MHTLPILTNMLAAERSKGKNVYPSEGSFYKDNLAVALFKSRALGFCVRVLQQAFYYAKGSAEPSCRTPQDSADFPRGPLWGGKHGPIWQKRASPSFYRVFSAPKTEKRVISAHENWHFSAVLDVGK